MVMTHLTGQLDLPPTRAASPTAQQPRLTSIEVPQPAYISALLILSEFSLVAISCTFSSPTSAPASNLELAAYLSLSPVQYKFVHSSSAQPSLQFDLLLSVQQCSPAS